MSGLNRAWRILCRFIARTDTTGAANSGGGTARVPLHNGTLSALRSGGRLYGFCKRTLVKLQDGQRYSERMRQQAIQRERRAKRRALVLFLKQLNSEQRQEFQKHRHFHVTGGSTGDRYRIHVGTIVNIDVLRKDGTVKHRLCARPADNVPTYDVMAAQLLHLQDGVAEPRFLQKANVQATLPDDQRYFRATWGA